jgi:hypothetical protein
MEHSLADSDASRSITIDAPITDNACGPDRPPDRPNAALAGERAQVASPPASGVSGAASCLSARRARNGPMTDEPMRSTHRRPAPGRERCSRRRACVGLTSAGGGGTPSRPRDAPAPNRHPQTPAANSVCHRPRSLAVRVAVRSCATGKPRRADSGVLVRNPTGVGAPDSLPALRSISFDGPLFSARPRAQFFSP